MKFFKRFSTALFKPKDIVHFRMDGFWRMLLYIITISLLVTLPTTIVNLKQQTLNYETKKVIRDAIKSEGEIPFKIVNGELVSLALPDTIYEAKINNTFLVVVSLDNNYSSKNRTQTVVLFANDGVYLKQSVASLRICKFSDYDEFTNLDLTKANLGDATCWDSIFSVIGKIMEKYKVITTISFSIVSFISNVGSIIIFSLVLAIVANFLLAGIVPFVEIWRMHIYLATPFVIGNLLSNLFGSIIFYYIGIVVLLVYSYLVSQAIVRIKIRKE